MKSQQKIGIDEMEILFKEHYAMLCLVAFSIVKNEDSSKDIVQDFFLSYWQKKDSVEVRTSFGAYANKAVKNLSYAFLKKAEKNRELLQDLKNLNLEEEKNHGDSKLLSKVQHLLNELPEARREIFISVVLHGQSYADIAEANGISINTVKTQMKRAYSFLRSKASEDFSIYVAIFSISLISKYWYIVKTL